MKIAVVGSGPAAAAACMALVSNKSQDREIDVLDAGSPLKVTKESPFKYHPSSWTLDTYAQIHRSVMSRAPGLIPEKSYRGHFLEHYRGSPTVCNGRVFGGLTKFWGASCLPFTQREFDEWPVTYQDMLASYRNVLAYLPVTGSSGPLEEYFQHHLYNGEPMRTSNVMQRLKEVINTRGGPIGFTSGNSRVAVRTRGDAACTYCGHCFYGCYNDSIYSADQTISHLAQENRLRYVHSTKVTKFEPVPDGRVAILFEGQDGTSRVSVYDRVFLGAGCIESTRIVSRSLVAGSGFSFPILENPVFTVPLLYLGPPTTRASADLMALSNILIGRLPTGEDREYVHIQVYPLNPYLYKHATLRLTMGLSLDVPGPLRHALQGRLFMMLLYLNGRYTRGSELVFEPERTAFRFATSTRASIAAKQVLMELGHILRHSGFKIVTLATRKLPPGSSYHYASTIPMGKVTNTISVPGNCELAPNVFVIDSSTFVDLPAQNQTFTIMANADRVARLSDAQ